MFIDESNRNPLLTAPKNKKIPRNLQINLSERWALLVVVDALLVMLAARGANWLWQQSAGLRLNSPLLGNRWYWLPILIGGWWMLAWFNDLYHIPSSSNKGLSAMRVGMVGLLGAIIYLVAFVLLPHLPPLLFFTYFLIIGLPSIVLWRWAYAIAFDRPPFRHRVLILGGGKRGRVIANILRQGPGVKCNVMGYVDVENGLVAPGETVEEELLLLGQEADLPRLAQELGIHEIVVAMERNLENHLFQLLVDCQAQGVRVSWMPNLYEMLYRQIPVEHIDAVWALHAMQGSPSFSRLQQYSKRSLDLILIVLALPVLLLLLPPLAVAIRLDSSGPVFYRQIRTGRGGKPFAIFKFRTMFVDAEKDGRARWATKGDPRITRVGHFLRKARLDELPQVINVLRGEMSLIGPRPERPEFIEELQRAIPFYRTRLMVKPGLTGWAQIHYDYGSDVNDALIKLRYDFYYVCYWSLWLDLYILFRTLGVVLRLKGT
jgi:exopolysaccharide biosynthesis polyprenyl glycosylphosphotransferase